MQPSRDLGEDWPGQASGSSWARRTGDAGHRKALSPRTALWPHLLGMKSSILGQKRHALLGACWDLRLHGQEAR